MVSEHEEKINIKINAEIIFIVRVIGPPHLLE
jgi:hypothetical protein